MNKSISICHYLKQAVYAAVFIWLVLLAMNCYSGKTSLVWAVGASALASSAYIVFTKPSYEHSQALHLIGSYVVSIVVGIVCSHVISFISQHTGLSQLRTVEVVTAMSVGLALFLQTVLNFQHPPAAGLSLILTSEPWHYSTLVIILAAVSLLALMSRLLGQHIKNLHQ